MYTPQKTNPTISSLLFLRWTPHYTTPPCALAHSLLLVAMVLLVVAAVLVDGRAIPDCGHFIPEEAPETLVSELREFWSQAR